MGCLCPNKEVPRGIPNKQLKYDGYVSWPNKGWWRGSVKEFLPWFPTSVWVSEAVSLWGLSLVHAGTYGDLYKQVLQAAFYTIIRDVR